MESSPPWDVWPKLTTDKVSPTSGAIRGTRAPVPTSSSSATPRATRPSTGTCSPAARSGTAAADVAVDRPGPVPDADAAGTQPADRNSLAAQRIGALKQAVGDPELADLNTSELSEQTSPADLLGQAGMMPFLTARRLIITQGYWARLEKRLNASESKESAAHHEAAQLLLGLATLPETSDIVFWEEKGVDKRRALWKGFTLPGKEGGEDRKIPGLQELIKQGVVTAEEAGTPDIKVLSGWLQRHAKAKAIDIAPAAVKLLTDFIGPNLRQLDNELEKLAVYATGRAITPDDVKLLVSDASEALIWDLTDALSQRDGRKAMRSLYELRRGDANAFYLLTMIARQYRIIIKVKAAKVAVSLSGATSGSSR